MAQLNESILTNQTVQSLQSIVAKVSSDPINSLVLIGAAVILIRGVLSLLSGNGIKAPYVGYRSFFEPAWLVRLRFSKGPGRIAADQ